MQFCKLTSVAETDFFLKVLRLQIKIQMYKIKPALHLSAVT